MKNKKCIIATIAVIVFVQVYEFIVHGIALKPMYDGTAAAWRTHEAMQANILWMILGQVLFALFFCLVYCCSKCTDSIKQGATFGFYIGLLMSSQSFIYYAVAPITLELMLAWVATGIIETVLMGVILAFLLKKGTN